MGSARGMLVLEIEYTAIQNELVAAKTLEAFFSTVNSACGGLGGQWKRFWVRSFLSLFFFFCVLAGAAVGVE